MNHSYNGVSEKHMTLKLVLGHRKFATNKPLVLWAQVYQWQTSYDLTLGSYTCQIHLLAMVYIILLHIYIYYKYMFAVYS